METNLNQEGSAPAAVRAYHRALNYIRRNSRNVNLAVNSGLLLICLVCYVLLVITFVSPSALRIESLVYADVGGIKPTVAVTLLAALLGTATLALVTRLVEHYFWLRLKPSESDTSAGLKLEELRNLAGWTISPVARIRYALDGGSPMIRFTGIFLLGAGVLAPVLVSGISQVEDITFQLTRIPRDDQALPFAGWVDDARDSYHGAMRWDDPTTIAAAHSLANMSAPIETSECAAGDTQCTVTARASAIHARCDSRLLDNPPEAPVGSLSVPKGYRRYYRREFQSDYNPFLKVTLQSSNPNGFANFTTAPRSTSDWLDSVDTIPNGTFGYIFGAYVPVDDPKKFEEGNPVRIVDCVLFFGTVKIRQEGGSPPTVDRSTFVQSRDAVYDEPSLSVIQPIYNELFRVDASPFSFQARQYRSSGKSNLAARTIGQYLLGTSAAEGKDPAVVARRIERAWEMATVMSWVRAPEAAQTTDIMRTKSRPRYTYNRPLLAYLFVLLLATVLVYVLTGGAVGDKEDVIGYDPLAIASIGGRIEGLGEGAMVHGFLAVGREKDVVFVHGEKGRRTWTVARVASENHTTVID